MIKDGDSFFSFSAPKDVRATIDREGILVRVPVNQQFVIHLLKKRKLEQKETAIWGPPFCIFAQSLLYRTTLDDYYWED